MLPARILIVEDSADNRLLIDVYLKGSPYQLTFEENGRDAFERNSTSDFDLILMDIQMPVMDGLAATRAIREQEQARGIPPVPIVALTANAGVKDVEKSGDAGCTAHVSKPVSKFELLSTIEKFARRPSPEPFAPKEALEPVNIEIPPGFDELSPRYLAKRRNEFPEMLELLAASDFARIATLTHNLKGTGSGYGFPEISRLGKSLEQLAKQRDGEALRVQLAELGNYLDRVNLVSKT
jgi:CheY-like chemotaxis protein